MTAYLAIDFDSFYAGALTGLLLTFLMTAVGTRLPWKVFLHGYLTSIEAAFRAIRLGVLIGPVHRLRQDLVQSMPKYLGTLDAARLESEERVRRLNATLFEAVDLIGEIHRQVNQGRQEAERLQKELETYEEAAQLSKEQSEAVAVLLGGRLEEHGRRSLRESFLLNAVFFVAGIVATLWLG